MYEPSVSCFSTRYTTKIHSYPHVVYINILYTNIFSLYKAMSDNAEVLMKYFVFMYKKIFFYSFYTYNGVLIIYKFDV